MKSKQARENNKGNAKIKHGTFSMKESRAAIRMAIIQLFTKQIN